MRLVFKRRKRIANRTISEPSPPKKKFRKITQWLNIWCLSIQCREKVNILLETSILIQYNVKIHRMAVLRNVNDVIYSVLASEPLENTVPIVRRSCFALEKSSGTHNY